MSDVASGSPTSTDPSGGGGEPGARAAATRDTAVERSSEIAHDAAAAATDLREEVVSEASEVAHHALDEARDLVGEARSRLGAEADGAVRQVGHALAEAGDDLVTMAQRSDHPDGVATEVVRRVGRRTGTIAERIESDGYRGIADDLASVARRHPGTFLLAAGLCGFLVGRALRNTDTHGLTDAAKEAATGDGRQRGAGSDVEVGPGTGAL